MFFPVGQFINGQTDNVYYTKDYLYRVKQNNNIGVCDGMNCDFQALY